MGQARKAGGKAAGPAFRLGSDAGFSLACCQLLLGVSHSGSQIWRISGKQCHAADTAGASRRRAN